MAEGPQVPGGSSVSAQSADQSEASSQTHLSRGAGLDEEGQTNQRSAYCKELLMRGGEEFSLEELRAERHNQKKQQELDEKLRHLMVLKEHLSVELEEKKKLLVLRKSQQQAPPEDSAPQSRDSAPAATSFQIYEESQSAAALPAGNELLDDVFLRPDERGLCLKVQFPQTGAVGSSQLPQTEAGIQQQSHRPCSGSGPDDQGGTSPAPQPAAESRPPPQKPAAQTRKKLSPIQETSVEASSLTSLGGCSPLEEQEQELDHTPSPAGGAVDPCHPDVRRRLLDLCDVTSSPDLHSERRPLPAVEEHSCVQLGGKVFYINSRVLDQGSFSVYEGTTEDGNVLVKVDVRPVPWDFHQFQRLRDASGADSLPLISCFLFPDGCVTVYTATEHMLTELTQRVPDEQWVGQKAVLLLQLLSQLQSCRLLHAALQPDVLTCFDRTPDRLFPLDWSCSVDLDLQQDVTSVQQVPSAQSYVSLGLLEPSAPPQLLDLVGVAETVHLLLTNSRMVVVRDGGGWTAERFSGAGPSSRFSSVWTGFFRSLLNAGGRSPSSVLSELTEQLSSLFL